MYRRYGLALSLEHVVEYAIGRGVGWALEEVSKECWLHLDAQLPLWGWHRGLARFIVFLTMLAAGLRLLLTVCTLVRFLNAWLCPHTCLVRPLRSPWFGWTVAVRLTKKARIGSLCNMPGEVSQGMVVGVVQQALA